MTVCLTAGALTLKLCCKGIFRHLGFFYLVASLMGNQMQGCKLYRSIVWICMLCSILVIARQIRLSQHPDSLKTIVQVHLQNSRKPLSVTEMSEPQQAFSMTQPKKCARYALLLLPIPASLWHNQHSTIPCRQLPRGDLTRADLLLVIPGSLDRYVHSGMPCPAVHFFSSKGLLPHGKRQRHAACSSSNLIVQHLQHPFAVCGAGVQVLKACSMPRQQPHVVVSMSSTALLLR